MILQPLALIAELTHRCPLHCAYCSNPMEMRSVNAELTTEEWGLVFQQAATLGILHVHLSGGEPLARRDLTDLVARARGAGLYTNLITSGIGLSEERLAALVKAGLEHIQLSLQDSRQEVADLMAGARSHARKLQLARQIRDAPLAFTLNVVVHRHNLDHLPEIIALAEELRPDRLEIAHVQYYGWAFQNRAALLPTQQQVERSRQVVSDARLRLEGRMRIDYVTPDYYARYPKACMGGWGRRLLLIDPAGRALPCHAATVIPGLEFSNVRQQSLTWIWHQSMAFQRFRGEDWMPEPCRSCERRTEDFGGCRCQAFLLTGNAVETDPVCSLASTRPLVDRQLAEVNGQVNTLAPLHPTPSLNSSWQYRVGPD